MWQSEYEKSVLINPEYEKLDNSWVSQKYVNKSLVRQKCTDKSWAWHKWVDKYWVRQKCVDKS